MKRKRRLLAASSMIAALTVAFVGCGQQEPNEQGSTGTLESEKGTKLSVMIPGHNPNDGAAWQNKVVKEFSEKYPDVTVEFVVAGWDSWETKVLANANSGEPIDIINDGANNNPKFALKGITQPLENYVDMKNENLHKNTMDAVFKYNNHYYVAVSETNVAVVYYNKNIFQNEGVEDPEALYKAGNWNWDNFVRIAKSLTNTKEKRWGFATNYPYLFYGANKTSMLTLNDQYQYTLNINSTDLGKSLELIQDGWYTSKWSGYDGDPWGTFYKGSAAMLADFQWVDKQILDSKQLGLADFEYGVVPMPSGPNNTDGVSPITAAGWAIGNGSDCPNHAGKLIDMFVNGQAAATKEAQSQLKPEHVELYKALAQKPFCTNSYDSAVGGAFEICGAIAEGQSVSQAIEEYKPIYQRMVDEANAASKKE